MIIFQEQVIRVAMALAGFTPGEADLLRRAMSRSRSARRWPSCASASLPARRRTASRTAVAEEAFHQLQGFATYGFCKSHAAAFALIAYQTLWLKMYYPAEFYCALLNHQPMGFYSPEVVMGDAQRHGMRSAAARRERESGRVRIAPYGRRRGAGPEGRAFPQAQCASACATCMGWARRAGRDCWRPEESALSPIWPISAAAHGCRGT